jgi:hypothetical protein
MTSLPNHLKKEKTMAAKPSKVEKPTKAPKHQSTAEKTTNHQSTIEKSPKHRRKPLSHESTTEKSPEHSLPTQCNHKNGKNHQ